MSLYNQLILFKNGESNAQSVYNEDIDYVIKIRTVAEKNKGKSLVELSFFEEDYIKLFMDDDDEFNNNEYLFNVAFGSRYYGGDYVFMDSYHAIEEFQYSGIDSLNEENLKILKDCIKIMRPSFDFNQSLEVIALKFHSLFDNEANEIAIHYLDVYDEALIDGLRQYIKLKLCDVLNSYGIFETTCAQKYFSTVNNIINIFVDDDSKKENSFLSVLKKFIFSKNLEIDEDLYEDYYSYFSYENFDSDSYNKSANRVLESLQDKLLEDLDSGTLEKNYEILNFLQKIDIKIGTWYTFPKEKSFGETFDYIYKVVDIVNGELIVETKKKGYESYIEKYYMSLDDFKIFLYHPELF